MNFFLDGLKNLLIILVKPLSDIYFLTTRVFKLQHHQIKMVLSKTINMLQGAH